MCNASRISYGCKQLLCLIFNGKICGIQKMATHTHTHDRWDQHLNDEYRSDFDGSRWQSYHHFLRLRSIDGIIVCIIRLTRTEEFRKHFSVVARPWPSYLLWLNRLCYSIYLFAQTAQLVCDGLIFGHRINSRNDLANAEKIYSQNTSNYTSKVNWKIRTK